MNFSEQPVQEDGVITLGLSQTKRAAIDQYRSAMASRANNAVARIRRRQIDRIQAETAALRAQNDANDRRRHAEDMRRLTNRRDELELRLFKRNIYLGG